MMEWGEPVRVIAGEARGRRLATLPGEDTRPTLERVKEGVFSAVQFWLPGANVLDLYAGSGQLGLEALSRGAARCTFVDESPKAVAMVRQNAASLGYADRSHILRGDADAFLARCREKFDLILLDPPYRAKVFPGILERLAPVAGPGALVLCESEAEVDFPDALAGFALEKQYRYGTVRVTRYKYNIDEDGDL